MSSTSEAISSFAAFSTKMPVWKGKQGLLFFLVHLYTADRTAKETTEGQETKPLSRFLVAGFNFSFLKNNDLVHICLISHFDSLWRKPSAELIGTGKQWHSIRFTAGKTCIGETPMAYSPSDYLSICLAIVCPSGSLIGSSSVSRISLRQERGLSKKQNRLGAV